MDVETLAVDAEVEKQLAAVTSDDPATQGRALAILTVLFSRCSEAQVGAVAAAVPQIHTALQSDNRLVQANAAAALTAAAALDDSLANGIATACTSQLVTMLKQCSTEEQPDVQLNVVSALGQLARDQESTAEAMMEPTALAALLSLADSQRPAKLQEAIADSLCALACQQELREQLLAAGAVSAVARLLNVSQLEVSVRCLMVLGMMVSVSQQARQALAEEAAALQQLMGLLKQNEDMDCKVIARDLLGVLMKDEDQRGLVEAAIRVGAAQQPGVAEPAAEDADQQPQQQQQQHQAS